MTARGAVSSVTYDDPSNYLTSSISSLSSQRAQSSWIARTYRHAAQLYLTRRLAEALDAIEPVVNPERQGSEFVNGNDTHETAALAAPVAASSRGTRVKVWSFYLTLLNAIIELGPEEGKLAFGSGKWKELAAKARAGTIWEDVVCHGYGSAEGDVDGEVVANLATLLLTHMPSQKLNQQRLETYLLAAANPSFDITAHMEASQNSRPRPSRTTSSGTDTPRDLNTRLKLLELYALHVLPRNEEWDYAKDFISMNENLDDERREAFLFALHSLQEEKNHDAIREAELRKRQEEEFEKRRQDEERQRLDEMRANEERRRQEVERKQRRAPSSNGSARDRMPPPPRPSNGNGQPNNSRGRVPPAKNDRGNRRRALPSPTLYGRATLLVASLQNSLVSAQRSMMQNPLSMLRFLLFLFAFMIAFARRDVREKVRRTFGDAIDRLRRTVGMGVKVSYI